MPKNWVMTAVKRWKKIRKLRIQKKPARLLENLFINKKGINNKIIPINVLIISRIINIYSIYVLSKLPFTSFSHDMDKLINNTTTIKK